MAFTIYHPEWGALRPILGVLCDMDGLLLDTEKLFARFWTEAAQALGFPMTWQMSLGLRSLSRQAGQARMESYFGPSADYTAIRAERIRRMDAWIAAHGVDPKPGLNNMLDALDRLAIPAAVTSSSPPERIRQYLEPLGFYHRFREICSGYEVPRGKPEPDIYLHGAARLGLAPENCLALEDSPAGILSAYRAGCMPVMIPDLDEPDGETRSRLFARADSLGDIPDLLNALQTAGKTGETAASPW